MSLYIDIEKTFPDFKLSVQLECANEVFALLGSSGCGKSLTLKCIAGIEKPDRGRIIINEQTVFDSEKGINIPPQKRQVGYLFQNYALFPNMTVWDNIFCISKKPKLERTAIVDGLIKSFQLEGVKKLYPRQISGGQQQRAALARILVSDPQILMLDEPFSALDTHLKWQMEQEIAAVLAKFPGTTIFVSHNRDEAYRISDKIAVMDQGQIQSIGSKEAIFNNPQTLAAALITGVKNVSAAQKVDDFTVRALDWGINLKTADLVPDNLKHVAVRAHHLELMPLAAVGQDNQFAGRLHNLIEEAFGKTLLFSFTAAEQSLGRLQLMLNNSQASEFTGLELMVCIPPDKVICLV